VTVEQKHWDIHLVNGDSETVFGAHPRVSAEGTLLVVREYYGSGLGIKDSRSFVLSNVLTWTEAQQ
jgi:hypothetical protein